MPAPQLVQTSKDIKGRMKSTCAQKQKLVAGLQHLDPKHKQERSSLSKDLQLVEQSLSMARCMQQFTN